MTLLVVSPPMQVLRVGEVCPDSPFHALLGLARADLAKTRDLPAAERRQWTEHFCATLAWDVLHPQLPLRLAVPEGVPKWLPRLCRSHYQWLPPDDIQSVEDLRGLDDFDLVLRLFDFSAWRPILGQRFTSLFGPPTADALLDVVVVDGIARVSFRDLRQILPNASAACGSAALLAALDATLAQVPGVRGARYSFGGDEAAFYEWLQMAPPD